MRNPKEPAQPKKETAPSPKPWQKPTGPSGPQKPGQQGGTRPETPKR